MNKKDFIKSVFILCLMVLPLRTVADDFLRGDVNQDGNVNISDVTCLINYLLCKHWPGEGPTEPEIMTYELNGIEINMVRVEGGTFTMGASGTDTVASSNEYPAHEVTLSTYLIGQVEVTQQLWRAVMGSNPSTQTSSLLLPVECVSWNNCQTFITKLNEMTGLSFRLPTEAEWEFAARGGSKSKGYKYAGSDYIYDVAWYKDNANSTTHLVATKAPNELGIYDMSGNVDEWVQDKYGTYPTGSQTNPTGPTSGSLYLLRGGDSYCIESNCRITRRNGNWGPNVAGYPFGLRLAMSCE